MMTLKVNFRENFNYLTIVKSFAIYRNVELSLRLSLLGLIQTVLKLVRELKREI